MTPREKLIEFIEFHAQTHGFYQSVRASTLAATLLDAFPQITKKPVKLHVSQIYGRNQSRVYCFEQLDRFKTTEERQAYLDNHFVELVK